MTDMDQDKTQLLKGISLEIWYLPIWYLNRWASDRLTEAWNASVPGWLVEAVDGSVHECLLCALHKSVHCRLTEALNGADIWLGEKFLVAQQNQQKWLYCGWDQSYPGVEHPPPTLLTSQWSITDNPAIACPSKFSRQNLQLTQLGHINVSNLKYPQFVHVYNFIMHSWVLYLYQSSRCDSRHQGEK